MTINMNKIKRKLGLFSIVTGLSITLLPTQVQAIEYQNDDLFHLVDFASDQEIETYETYDSASYAFSVESENYENLGIVRNGTVLTTEVGIVLLNTSEACDYLVEYEDVNTEETNHVNGCNGIDGAYLSTDYREETITYMISGAQMKSSIEDITIIPFEWISSRISVYLVKDGVLYHEVKTQMENDNYAYIIALDDAPSYLEENTNYYSYDGHYFYEDLHVLADDYQNDIRENSINFDNPFYNYYQFVSHRTITNAPQDTVQSYFEIYLGINGPLTSYRDVDKEGSDDKLTKSQFYNNFNAFWQYQYEYGANALMMLTIAQMESSYGRSSLSYTRNNLFAHAAYDNELEASSSRYSSIASSIYSHARYYISGTYASPLKAQYHGSFFGNLASGMNVNYSTDPYWGEKAASNYRELDLLTDANDKGTYAIAISTTPRDINVYDAIDGNVLYSTDSRSDAAFVVLWEEGDYYAIQLESTINEDRNIDLTYYYDYETSYGYIQKDAIDLLLDSQNGTYVPDYVHVSFDAEGGVFVGGNEIISYAMPIYTDASAITPEKEKALFIGWDKELTGISEDTQFHANYKDVDHIELTSLPQTEYELNDRIVLDGGILTVYFEDETSEEYTLTTSMISGFDLSQSGEQVVTVQYAGCVTEFPINVSEEKDVIRAEIKQEIEEYIEIYKDAYVVTGVDAEKVISLKQKIDENMLPYLTQTQMRQLDSIIRMSYEGKIRYIIDENQKNLGVSGLCTSIPLEMESLTKNRFLKDTYRVQITDEIDPEAEFAMSKAAFFLNSNENETFHITIQKNLVDAIVEAPLVFTMDKPKNAQEGDVYTVLFYDDNGDVIECYTRQSDNKITFMTYDIGDFMLVSQLTSNVYTGEDPVESLTNDTNSFDMENALIKLTIAVFIFLLFIVILSRIFSRRRKKKSIEVHDKKSEKVEKEIENLDITQALHILDTQMISLEEIREAEEKLDEVKVLEDAEEKETIEETESNVEESSDEETTDEVNESDESNVEESSDEIMVDDSLENSETDDESDHQPLRNLMQNREENLLKIHNIIHRKKEHDEENHHD